MEPLRRKSNGSIAVQINNSPLIENSQKNIHSNAIELESIYHQSQDLLRVLDQAVSEFEKASDKSTTNLLIFRFIMVLLTFCVMALLYYTFLAKALRHNAQDVLLKDKAILRFKKLFDYSYEGLIILDKSWNIEHTNQAAKNIFLGSDKNSTIDNFWQNTLSVKWYLIKVSIYLKRYRKIYIIQLTYRLCIYLIQ